MSYTRRNEPYNELSERIEAIEQLRCSGHKWSSKGLDLHANQQKLFCQTQDGREYVLKAEYLDPYTVMLTVDQEYLFNAYFAIRSEFPTAEIVGEQNMIRVSIDYPIHDK